MGIAIEREDLPAWHEIGSVENGLILNVHPDAFEYQSSVLSNSDILRIRSLSQLPNMPGYIPISADHPWGFGEVLVPAVSSREGWLSWQATFPRVARDETMREANWPAVFALSASLNAFFMPLSLYDGKTDSKFFQLVDIDLMTDTGLHGGSFSVNIARTLIPWIDLHDSGFEDPKLADIMKQAYAHMLGEAAVTYSRFRVLFRNPKWVNLICPNNLSTCSLDPERYDISSDKGYTLLSHNVDNPVQQLTLLSGVAAMCDMARADGF